jgi:multidrug efflux system outer membrane protein
MAATVKALQLRQSKYERGRATFWMCWTAERTLLSDERILVQLLGQRMQMTVALIKALGGTW